MKKKLIVVVICVVIISSLFIIINPFHQENKKFDSQLFRNAIVARMESAEEKGEYLLITRAEGYTMMIWLCDLEFNYTGDEFEGEWLYKIIYNWNGYCNGCEEITVLVNEKSISINGVNYTFENMEYLLEQLEWQYWFYQKEGNGISIES